MLIHAASGQRQAVTTLSAWFLPDGSRICVNAFVCMFVNIVIVAVKIEVSWQWNEGLFLNLFLILSCYALIVCVCLSLRSVVTLCNPVDCSLSGSSAHGIFQARILEWVSISSSRGSSWHRDGIHVSCIGKWILYPSLSWLCNIYFPAIYVSSWQKARCLLRPIPPAKNLHNLHIREGHTFFFSVVSDMHPFYPRVISGLKEQVKE